MSDPNFFYQIFCKSHRWVTTRMTSTSGDTFIDTHCGDCGATKPASKPVYVTHDSILVENIIEKIDEYLRYEDGSILRRNPTFDRFKTWLKKGRV